MEGIPEVCQHQRVEIQLVKEITMRGFYEHTSPQSRTATHCRRLALSNPFVVQLASPCEPEAHRLPDNNTPPTLPRHTGAQN